VALVEKGDVGGTCLNTGCIPSKALLASVHFLTLAKHANLMGMEIGEVKPNWGKMQSRKDAIVVGFRKGVAGLVQSNGIKLYAGRGIVRPGGKVCIEAAGGAQEIEAKKVILATGSAPIEIGAFKFDGKTIISSTEALSLAAIPQSMVIIGGGIIGCEMACVYAAVGCKVTIVEALESILPNEDAWVGALMTKELKKIGIESMAGQKVTGVAAGAGRAKVSLAGGTVLEAEKVLVAVGRRAVCDKETVEGLGLAMNGPAIAVNERMETSAAGVYALGDAVGTTYLAHGAFMEAEVAAANACGEHEEMKAYHLVPRAVYTFPEVASVGRSEKRCAEMGIATYVGKANFRSNGRSVAHNEGIGEVRVIRNTADDAIMGVTMVGATVTEMLGAARALIGSREKITEMCFPHPTVSEVLKEAWEDAFGISLHVPPRR
jgi:dihydrolipoamide dehydrogenase